MTEAVRVAGGEQIYVDVFHSVVLLILLMVCGAWSLARPSRPAAGVLALLSVLWLLFNAPLEGRVLWVLDADHGFTESDVLVICGLALSALAVYRCRSGGRSAS